MSIQHNICNSGIIGFWIFSIAILFYCQIDENNAQGGAGDRLQQQLDFITARLNNITRDLNTAIGQLTTRINMVNMAAMAAATAAAAAQAAIDDELVPEIANITMTVSKLVNINKTWKSNFKIVNSTLMILRRKLSFRAPHIPLS